MLSYLNKLPREAEAVVDPHSGLAVTRLSSAIGHSHGLYFTSDGWTADQRFFIMGTERAGQGNQLYAVDLEDYSLLQLTDLAHGAVPDHYFNYASLSPDLLKLVFWNGNELTMLSLLDGGTQVIFTTQGDIHGTSWTADGQWILTCRSETVNTGNGSSTEDRLRWLNAPPLSQVIAVHVLSGRVKVLHEERWLITHVNASPTDPDLCTFCHEGPWLTIDQRIWGLRLSGGDPWAVVPKDPEWGVGHEYWCMDGRTVGYHARHRDGSWRHAAGFADVLGGDYWQAELSVPTHHAVALHSDMVILDGTRESGEWLMVVPREGDAWGEARILCRHGSSRAHHRAHVHPRPRLDGRVVSFNSDRRGYADAYHVEVPEDISTLPVYPGKPYRYYWE